MVRMPLIRSSGLRMALEPSEFLCFPLFAGNTLHPGETPSSCVEKRKKAVDFVIFFQRSQPGLLWSFGRGGRVNQDTGHVRWGRPTAKAGNHFHSRVFVFPTEQHRAAGREVRQVTKKRAHIPKEVTS